MKMEEERLTVYRYPLHFELCGACPISRRGSAAEGRNSKPKIQKPSVPAEGFCFSYTVISSWSVFSVSAAISRKTGQLKL